MVKFDNTIDVIKFKQNTIEVECTCTEQTVADSGGGATGMCPPPPKFYQLLFFFKKKSGPGLTQ